MAGNTSLENRQSNIKIAILSGVILAGFCSTAYAQTSVYHNLGFLEGSIWYSKDPFYSGDQIRIYSAVFNSSPDDLLGTVQFYDNGAPIGSRFDFSVQGGGRIQDVWTDWTATSGDHKITAKILDAELAPIGKAPQKITVANEKTGESDRQVAEPPKTEPGPNSANVNDATSSIISVLPNDIAKFIPQPVQKTVGVVEGAIDNAANQTADYLETKKSEIEAEESAGNNSGSPNNGTTTAKTSRGNTKEIAGKKSEQNISTNKSVLSMPKISVSGFWDEARILGINMALFILHRLWLMYLIILILIFLVLRWIIRKIRS